jgi:predicted DNA-binding protein (MmcQ/YjbR family)
MDIETLRTYCLSLPGATEAIRWEHHLNFYVGEKMFCITTLDADGQVGFKTTPEQFAELCARPGLSPSSHLARAHWVFVERFDDLSDGEWRERVAESYRLVREKLPKKVQAALEKI